MLKFNIVPKAELLTEDIIERKKKTAYWMRWLCSFPFCIMLIMLMGILGIYGHMAINLYLFGVMFIIMGILSYHQTPIQNHWTERNGNIGLSPVSAIYVGCILIVLTFCVVSNLGIGFFLKLALIAFAMKEVILPLPIDKMKKEQAARCTETVTAYITDDQYEDYSFENIEDLDVNSKKYIWLNSSSYLDCYQYIYTVNGERYLMSLPYSYTKNHESRSKKITLKIDPDNPENYYSEKYTQFRKKSDIIGCMIIFGIITAVLAWKIFF